MDIDIVVRIGPNRLPTLLDPFRVPRAPYSNGHHAFFEPNGEYIVDARKKCSISRYIRPFDVLFLLGHFSQRYRLQRESSSLWKPKDGFERGLLHKTKIIFVHSRTSRGGLEQV